MAMGGVFAVTNIGNDKHSGNFFFYGVNGPGDDGIIVGSDHPGIVFFFRNTEQDDSTNACIHQRFTLFNQYVNGHLEIAGHGFNGIFHVFSRTGKQRHNQVVNGYFGFGYHVAQHGVLT